MERKQLFSKTSSRTSGAHSHWFNKSHVFNFEPITVTQRLQCSDRLEAVPTSMCSGLHEMVPRFIPVGFPKWFSIYPCFFIVNKILLTVTKKMGLVDLHFALLLFTMDSSSCVREAYIVNRLLTLAHG